MRQAAARFFLTVIIVVLCMSIGGTRMTDANKVADEADRLLVFLSSEEIHPLVLEKRLQEYGAASRNEAVARLAKVFEPVPSGKLITRLPYILTEQNKSDMAFVFVVNLRSPDPEARTSCLYGLQKLNYPALNDFALLSLRDTNDQVVYAACYILLPKTKQDAGLWRTLQNLYAARKGKQEFYMSMSLLEAHGIERPTPGAK
ncbi:MAG: hypothetical protein M3430_13655 [Acidobacteriota bacterium]|nr:hypothetical protein [Acidobacteriota bacterium]